LYPAARAAGELLPASVAAAALAVVASIARPIDPQGPISEVWAVFISRHAEQFPVDPEL
jgi:hypothetical protein